MAKEERAGAARVQRILTDRPRYVNLMVLLRILCEITATVVLVGGLIDVLSLGWALTVTAVIMVLVSYVVIGVGPRTLGRQHAYSIAMAASLPLLWIGVRSEEHTSELQSLMRISYAVFCLKKKKYHLTQQIKK